MLDLGYSGANKSNNAVA